MSLFKPCPWVLALASATLLFTASVGFGEVIFVDADATGTSNGTSWEDAYTDLQDALADAADSGVLPMTVPPSRRAWFPYCMLQ